MKHFNSPSNRRGFTLVEIMVVVLIVGILSVIAMFVLGKIKNVTAHSLLENNLRQLYQAKEYYFLESGTGGPVTANELVAQGYIKASQIFSLYQNGSMETHMGWVYDGTFYPKDPVAANLLPSGPSKTASTESIYYPGPPASGRNSAYAIFAAAHTAGGANGPQNTAQVASQNTPPTSTVTRPPKPPALIGDVTAQVKEDGPAMITGNLKSPSGSLLHLGDHILSGTYGSLDVRDQGHWVYKIQQNSPEVQSLKSGESRTDKFQIQLPDGSSQTVAVTVVGQHDLPVISIPSVDTPTVSKVELVSTISGATDLGHFVEQQQGLPVGSQLVGLYMPGSSANELDGVSPANLPKIGQAYQTVGQSGYHYFEGSGVFSQLMPTMTDALKPVSPNIKNAWSGGIAVFADGSVARLTKVCVGNTGEKDYIYMNVIKDVNAKTGITVISGTGTAGENVQVRDGTNVLGSVHTDPHGHWSVGVSTALTDGQHAINTVQGGVTTNPKVVDIGSGVVTAVDRPSVAGTVIRGDSSRASAQGSLSVTDADRGDRPTFVAQTAQPGHFGTFSITPQGKWSYTLNPAQPTLSSTPPTETFKVEVRTESGEVVTKEIVIDVN